MTKVPIFAVGDRSWRPKSRFPASASVPSPLCYAGGGRPLSFGLDFVRPFSRSADLERARLCPRLIKWLDMLFILSGFLFYGVREKRRAAPSAVARVLYSCLGSENHPLVYLSSKSQLWCTSHILYPFTGQIRVLFHQFNAHILAICFYSS